MTYPPPVYFGDSGQFNATRRPATEQSDLSMTTGVEVSFLVGADQTDGEFTLFRWDTGPTPVEAFAHFHRSMTETFFVVSGIMTFFNGVEWIEAGPGDVEIVPKGSVHGFRNDHGETSILMLATPGAPREAYFALLADRVSGALSVSPDEWVQICAQHDQFYPH